MTKYKVWIEVEHCDEDNDFYANIALPFGAVREFDSKDEAIEFADRLKRISEYVK